LAVDEGASGSGIYDDSQGVRVIGVFRWLQETGVALLVEQDTSEVFGVIYATVLVNAGVALAAVFLAVGASLLVTRSIARPLISLADTATRIAAGDIDRIAPVESDDEIGRLARAFNSMTGQLSELIAGLEQRVEGRTKALRHRALQLETSAQVSREITAILETDVLLSRVVELIRHTFGYYSVRVFLVDEDTNALVRHASSGETPPAVARLDMAGDSLNAEAVRANQHVFLSETGQGGARFGHGESSEVRSELVIPLRVGGDVIGTLDVVSRNPDAFSTDDVLALQSLGDQLAIAIVNARLYRSSQELAVVQERNRLARELHDSVTQSLYSLGLLAEGWRRMVSAGQEEHVEDHLARIGEIAQSALREMRRLIYELRPPLLEEEGLLGALHRRLDAVEGRVGIDAGIVAEDLIELPPHIEEGLYRIALEALNNSLKHAAAKVVAVRISADNGRVVLEVKDDGVGFDPQGADLAGGMGFASMRERAAQIGGDLSISAEPGAGTVVRVAVDCAEWDGSSLVDNQLGEVS
jgi:nitrate/nitrite-specific signal transduction histidine kinase